MKRPYFSIPIATYNRGSEIEFAIKRLLAQSFKDFEIIISDDNSTDKTARIIKGYRDKRIKYHKNKKNLGAVKNINHVLSYVSGRYVFMHGDDDYLLYDDVLERAHKIIENGRFGLVRMNYLYQTQDKKRVFDFLRYKTASKNLLIIKESSASKILRFMEQAELFFITGIIYKNPGSKILIGDSELLPWFKVCYENIKKSGGFYSSKHDVIASWSHQKKNPVFYVINGKLSYEDYYDELRTIAGEAYYNEALKRQIIVSINNFPTIKYNSDNKNLIKYATRIIEIDKYYIKSIKFWMLLISAFILPKFILRLIKYAYMNRLEKIGKTKDNMSIISRVAKVRGFK